MRSSQGQLPFNFSTLANSSACFLARTIVLTTTNERTDFELQTRKAIADTVVSAKLRFSAFSGSRSDDIIYSGGYSLGSREDDIDTVDSARLPCFPPTVPKALHHISLLRSEFIERDDAC